MINSMQNPFELLNVKLPCPLCIEEDRYGGCYSGAKYLAFNMSAYNVWDLDHDAGDLACEDFWENEASNYIIGKGNTPEEALIDLITQLKDKKGENR